MAGLRGIDAECDGVEQGVTRSRNLDHARVVESALRGIELRVRPHRQQLRIADRVGVPTRLDVDGVADGRQLAVGARGSPVGPGHVEHLLVRQPLLVRPALHDLDAVEVGVDRVLEGGDQEGRRPALRRRGQVSAHGHALFVSGSGGVGSQLVSPAKAPPAEEVHLDARAGGGVHFFPLHRVEERRPGVLLGPDRHQPGGSHVPPACPGDDVLGLALRRRVERHLAVEVVLLGRGHGGV